VPVGLRLVVVESELSGVATTTAGEREGPTNEERERSSRARATQLGHTTTATTIAATLLLSEVLFVSIPVEEILGLIAGVVLLSLLLLRLARPCEGEGCEEYQRRYDGESDCSGVMKHG
jgi:hypothetical protein